MVVFGRWNDTSVTISVKSNSLTISFSSKSNTNVYSFDRTGRLWTAMRDQVSYRCGLNGKIVAKWGSNFRRFRRWISTDEADDLVDTARTSAERLLAGILSGEIAISEQTNQEIINFLEIASRYTLHHFRADILNYHQVYKPVGILPPDQYMSVVLQLTEGCSFNTCTFCSFYRDRPFRIKRPDEFLEHARAVKDYLGQGLSIRRTIFLGDANALVVPMPRLLPLLDMVHQTYDVEALGGMFAFLDGFSGERKTHNDYAQLKDFGMKRIYIGMESGNAELLRFLKKPGAPDDVIRAVDAIKSAGISVGIIVLLGAGGRTFEDVHIADTVKAINRMNLDLDDLIYFSELIESENIPYVQQAYDAGLRPLSEDERIQQGEAIENRLFFSEERGTPHISRYDIREFVY